jgi:hypothetical protein
MSNRITTANLTAAAFELHNTLIVYGLLEAGSMLTAVNTGSGYKLACDVELPWWVEPLLGPTAQDAYLSLRGLTWRAIAFDAGTRAAVGLANGAALDTWKTLVDDGMAPVPAVTTANALT